MQARLLNLAENFDSNLNIFCLEQKYSTLRMVTRRRPTLESCKDGRYENVLFLQEGKGRLGEGGLRKRGYFKTSRPDKPLITIVTIVFNGEQFLEKTIQSVINQTYDNVEYIIIDGGSTDGTLDVIKSYEHAIDYWVSENDEGIYDALNKGIALTTGQYINFMNAGDWLFKNETLRSIFSSLEGAEVTYGNLEVRYASGRKRHVEAGKVRDMWKGSQFCHQAVFVNTQYQKANKFNLGTKIVADFEFFYSSWRSGANFKHISLTVCSFQAGGVSDLVRVDVILSFWLIVEKGFWVNAYYLSKIISEIFKSIIKKLKVF